MEVSCCSDPGDASELGVCEIHAVYEFKDSWVAMFVRIFSPGVAGSTTQSSWNICGS